MSQITIMSHTMHGDDYVPQNVPRLADSCMKRVPRQAQQGGEPGHHEPSRISHQGHIPRHKWQVSWHKCQGKTHYSWVMVHWVTKVPQLYHPSCKVCWWVLVHTGPTLGASQVFLLVHGLECRSSLNNNNMLQKISGVGTWVGGGWLIVSVSKGWNIHHT